MPAHTMPSYTEFATKAFFSPFSFAYCNRIYYKRDREKEKNMNTKSNKNTAKVYFTGDLHFGHFNAIKYDCRPWSDVETMAAGMIECWNARVTDDDLVYILGDVCYRSKYPAWHYLEQMRGHKILIVGNHDGELLEDERSRRCFEEIHSYMEIKEDGKKIVLCHYPMAEWNGKTRGSWHIFAHIHAQRNEAYKVMRDMPHALNAGCMLNDFAPATFAELIANNQKFNAAD